MKVFIFVLLFILLFSCNKKHQDDKIIINSQDYFSKLTDFKNLKVTKKFKINDSTYSIKGEIDTLNITGYLTQNNEKIEWWRIFDAKNNIEYALIEYRLVDDKEFANQYKIFNNSNINIYLSKYYTLFRSSSSISFNFYVPKSKEIINTKGKFLYFIKDAKKNKVLIDSECECNNFDNQFRCNFSIPNKKNIIISGVFFEVSQTNDGKMGGSEIYVRDTIN